MDGKSMSKKKEEETGKRSTKGITMIRGPGICFPDKS